MYSTVKSHAKSCGNNIFSYFWQCSECAIQRHKQGSENGGTVFSPGPYSRLCRPALIPDRPALMCLSLSEIY